MVFTNTPVPTLSHVEAPGNSERRTRSRPSRADSLALGCLPDLLGYNLRKAQVAVAQRFQDAVAPHDITSGQYGVLTIIRENEGLSQSDLGAAVGIDRSTMVAVIDRLETRGLVVRAPSPNDRRSYALRLSDLGHALMEEVTPRILAQNRALVDTLEHAEADRLVHVLRRIAQSH
jgi:DNA-binding MarR family transcriptional regulator